MAVGSLKICPFRICQYFLEEILSEWLWIILKKPIRAVGWLFAELARGKLNCIPIYIDLAIKFDSLSHQHSKPLYEFKTRVYKTNTPAS